MLKYTKSTNVQFWDSFYFNDPTTAAPDEDTDRDGQTNLVEYNNGTNPLTGSHSYYVDVNGNNDWDGLAPVWNGEHGPKASIQAAIDETSPDEDDQVILADGVYTGVRNRNINFTGKSITVRSASGDPNACVIDCESSGHGFCFCSDETADAAVSGLTIRNGSAESGAGIYCLNSSPTIHNCIISGNTSNQHGGGFYCNGGSPTINNCFISGNTTREFGGGIYCTNGSLTLNSCILRGNDAVYYGGAFACGYGNHTINNCVIDENDGGGVFNAHADLALNHCDVNKNFGSGVDGYDGSLTLNHCGIQGNITSLSGGGISFNEHCLLTLNYCSILGNQAGTFGGGIHGVSATGAYIRNCIISGNSAPQGGGVCLFAGNSTFANCTVSGNSADEGGGVYCWFNHNATIDDCILWDNAPEAIFVVTGTPSVAYSDVQGGWPGTGNFSADPLFARNPDDGGDGWGDDPNTPDVDEGANDDYGDLRLLAGSPCIDAGANALVPTDTLDLDGDGNTTEPVPFDLAGDPRFMDDLGTPNVGDAGETGLPVVDMGAYEFQDITCLGDLDGDGSIGLNDLAQLLGHFGQTGVLYRDGDLDVDGDVDLEDLAEFLSHYGDPCP